MSRPDPRRPVQPWIPQRPQQPQPRTVYVRERPADGRKALRAGWILNAVALGMTVVLLVIVLLLGRHEARTVAADTGTVVGALAMAGWWFMALLVMGLIDLAILVLVIVAMAQGAVGRALALFVASIPVAILCWLGLTVLPVLVEAWAMQHFATRPVPAPGEGEERKIGGGFSPLPR
jgi:hypothetical protein